MKRKLFTFLVAFLATLSGAVWGQNGSGTEQDPYVVNLDNPTDIDDVLYGNPVTVRDEKIVLYAGNAIQNTPRWFRLVGTSTKTVSVELYDAAGGQQDIYIILDNAEITAENPIWLENPDRQAEQFVHIILAPNSVNRLSATNDAPAITVGNDTNVDISGTGMLYAKGAVGIGLTEGNSGDITITEGTVIATGTSGAAFGGTASHITTLTINGNTLVVAQGAKGVGALSENFTKGIYYDNTDTGNEYAIVRGDILLDSKFPPLTELDENIVLNIEDNASLTLGSGVSFRLENLLEDDYDKVNAYSVVYKNNLPEGAPVTGGTWPSSMLYGYNTTYKFASISGLTTTVNNYIYQPIASHWLNNGKQWVATESEVSTNEEKPTGIQPIEYSAAWVLKKANLEYLSDQGLQTPLNIYAPDGAALTIEPVSGDGFNTLDEVGLQLAGRQIKKADSYSNVTANDYKVKLNFTPTGDGISASAVPGEISIKVTSTTTNVSELTIASTGTDMIYNGKVRDIREAIQITNQSGEVVSTELFDIECSLTGEGTFSPVDLKNAGFYYVKITAKANTAYTGSKFTDAAIVTIKPAKATVTAKDVEWTIGTTGPTFTDALTVKGVGEDQLTATCTEPTGSWAEAGVYKVTYTNIKLSDENNYESVSDVTGKLIVKKEGTEQDPITPGENENPEIIPGTDEDMEGWKWDSTDKRFERTYDGLEHPLEKISFKYINEGETAWETLTVGTNCEVSYTPLSPKDVNENGYTATITITKSAYYSGTATINLYINPAELTINLNVPATIEKGQNVSTWWIPEMAKFTGVQNEEPAKIEGTLSISEFGNANVGDKVKAIIKGLNLVENTVESKTFKPSNYNPTWKNGDASITVTGEKAEIDGIIVVDPKPNYPEEIKPGDEGWKWDADAFTRVYDGQAHEIQSLIVDGETLKVGTDYTVVYNPQDVKNAGSYTAVITFTNPDKYQVISMPLKITERKMKVTFNVPNHIESTDPITITDEYVNYEAQSGNRGLVTNEAPEIESGEFVFEESSIEGKYKVILRNFVLGSSNTFNPDNYKLQIWDATQDIYVEYDNTGDDDDDITIIDPEHPDNNPNEPGGGVVVGPDDEGQQPSKNFCNIYVAEGSSPFIQFNPSRRVVEAVGKITVDVVIPDEIGTEDVKLTFRRGDGAWEALTIDEETQKYTIKDINTHIYLKAEVDAALLDAEPNENHVYIDLSCTEDGIKLDAEREIVENGEDVLIWAEISKENLNKAIKYEYKVTRFGEWKELKATENTGEFIIWNVTNDVFVRAYLADQTEDPETAEVAHHVYSDLSVTCKGLYLDADRKMVANNGTTKVYLTIEPNYNVKNAHYMFRRGIHEAWEELTPSTEANVFVVTGIESDIYLKATDAVPTGMEDIDGTARVYAKDGSLYIYTPQQDDIAVISMTGSVVKRTKQIGLQSYPLNQGIYVVRVGEQIFKVRVK